MLIIIAESRAGPYRFMLHLGNAGLMASNLFALNPAFRFTCRSSITFRTAAGGWMTWKVFANSRPVSHRISTLRGQSPRPAAVYAISALRQRAEPYSYHFLLQNLALFSI